MNFLELREDIISNATIIFEVLSESTKNYDKGDKADEYRSMPDLKEHFLVDQNRPHVVHYYKKAGTWNYETHDDPATNIQFKSVDCRLDMQEIYLDINFEASE